MADSKKPARPSTPRKPGPARKPRPGQGKRDDDWSTSGPKRSGGPKPSGGPKRSGGPKPADGPNSSDGPKRSGGPKPAGSGYGPAKSGGKPGAKYGGKSDGKPGAKYGGKPGGKPGEKGRDERSSKPPRRDERQDQAPAKAPARKANDDYDYDIDVNFDREPGSDVQPAAFPKPARPPKGHSDRPATPAGKPSGDRDSRPARPRFEKSGRPDTFGKSDRYGKPSAQARPAAPRAAEAPELEDGKSVTAGRNPVRELLESTPRRIDAVLVRKGQRDAKVQEIVALSDENGIKVQFVDDLTLRRMYAGSHQGVVAITAAVEYAELETLIASVKDAPLPVLLALDQVQDPGNLGAMARTAWALGAAGIIVPRHGGAYIGAGAMRSSAGALHHLPVARVTNMSQALDACAEAGLSIICTDTEGENLYTAAIDLPAVLVMGGEEKGVRHGVGKHCQKRLAIPLKRTFDSLNVAQAAAICLARFGQL